MRHREQDRELANTIPPLDPPDEPSPESLEGDDRR